MTAGRLFRGRRTGALRLLVLALALGCVMAVGGDAVAAEGAADPASNVAARAYDDIVDLTFPVDGSSSYTDSYEAARGGGTRAHKATDIMADYRTPVHAAMGGEITWITGVDKAVPGYGYMISIAGDDGRRYSYIHLGRQDEGPQSAYLPGIARGARVERGQRIGWVGCSGNASCSAPHLHLEIEDDAVTDPYGGHRMNPYASLVDAERRGDLPAAPRPSLVDACAPTSAVPDTPVRRVSANDAVATSAAVSATGWTSAAEAVVATSEDFADALAGAALAAERKAPLLLVGADLESATAGELARLGVERVTILGGPNAVPIGVEAAIDAVVPRIERIGGRDRFATAAAISEHLNDAGAEIALALGRHDDPQRSWPDAISAGALASGERTVPVLLSQPDELPEATSAQLVRAREAGATNVLVIGGTAAIEEQVEDEIEGLGLSAERLGGENRYATSGAHDTLVAASGESFVDALPAGPLAARAHGTLLLVPPCNLESAPGVAAYVTGRYVDGYVVGARSAVSESVREVLTNAIAG
jgi:hypothetical protein